MTLLCSTRSSVSYAAGGRRPAQGGADFRWRQRPRTSAQRVRRQRIAGSACPGNTFTSPTPDQMLGAAEAIDCGGGVLFIVKNYAGDRMNFSLAAEM